MTAMLLFSGTRRRIWGGALGETGGHSVAAYMGLLTNRRKKLPADGLVPPHEPEEWPNCYFHGTHGRQVGKQQAPICNGTYARHRQPAAAGIPFGTQRGLADHDGDPIPKHFVPSQKKCSTGRIQNSA